MKITKNELSNSDIHLLSVCLKINTFVKTRYQKVKREMINFICLVKIK